MARGGAGPKTILKQLAQTYSLDPAMLRKFPKPSQLKSCKSYLLQELEKGWQLETFADLCEWCNPRLCKTKDAFFGLTGFDSESDEKTFQSKSFDFQNMPIVLKSFTHTYSDDGMTKESYGIVLTSRRIFRNVRYAAEGQGRDGIFAAADGTYRLHHGNWTLVAFGTYRLRYTRGKYSKNFVPWAYMFVRTENELAYEMLFCTVARFAQEVFRVQLNVKFGSLDHSTCIANAYVTVWPDIVLMGCYAHVARKYREKAGLLRDKRFFDTNIAINIRQMNHARSPEQFSAIAKKCVAHWRKEKENDYADWFEQTYLEERWSRWYTTCAMPSILPSQNTLESHNGVIKICGVTSKKVKTGVVLNDSIPGVLAIAAQDIVNTSFGHICKGPLLSNVVSRTFVHVADGAHYGRAWTNADKTPRRSMWFNSSKYRQKPNESPSHASRKLEWSVMELLGQFRLTQALAILPTTKVSGGQRKIRGALHTDDSTSKTFTKGYLIPKILENPLYVIWCQVHEEFDITVNGVELIHGIIKGFCYGTKYKWRVKFSDGDQMYFECEALVKMIISSRKRGLDVTNSAAAEKYRRCIFDCEADC